MKLYRRQGPRADVPGAPGGAEFVTPHPLNDELRALVARANALDRWALAGAVSHAKVKAGAYGKGKTESTSVAQAITLVANPIGATPDPRLTFAVVEDGAGLPWSTEITTGDCVLEVSWSCVATLDWTTGFMTNHFWYRHVVYVDGIPFAGPWCAYGAQTDSTPVRCHVPLAAGSHVVAPAVEVWHLNEADGTLTLNTRQLVLVEKAR